MTNHRPSDFPDFRKGKRSKKKLRGGPMAGVTMQFLDEDQSFDVELRGQWVGRYVRREIAQKNRTISVFEWETPSQRRERLTELLALGGPL